VAIRRVRTIVSASGEARGRVKVAGVRRQVRDPTHDRIGVAL
jgi:hypothetical protein